MDDEVSSVILLHLRSPSSSSSQTSFSSLSLSDSERTAGATASDDSWRRRVRHRDHQFITIIICIITVIIVVFVIISFYLSRYYSTVHPALATAAAAANTAIASSEIDSQTGNACVVAHGSLSWKSFLVIIFSSPASDSGYRRRRPSVHARRATPTALPATACRRHRAAAMMWGPLEETIGTTLSRRATAHTCVHTRTDTHIRTYTRTQKRTQTHTNTQSPIASLFPAFDVIRRLIDVRNYISKHARGCAHEYTRAPFCGPTAGHRAQNIKVVRA